MSVFPIPTADWLGYFYIVFIDDPKIYTVATTTTTSTS